MCYNVKMEVEEIKNKIIQGDCVNVMKKIEANSVDTIITDPPYATKFMGKKWDTEIAFQKETWKQALRVAKPGATMLVFGGTRTYHRLACAIEDAGWILKDCIMWIYGSGFTKATDISKQLDKGYKRKIVGKQKYTNPKADNSIQASSYGIGGGLHREKPAERVRTDITEPSTQEAKLWNGWKSHGLKPAYEPILVAMKPNEGSYANNALKHGVAGLNIDGGRIEHNEKQIECKRKPMQGQSWNEKSCGFRREPNQMASASPQGRFPANVILDEKAAKMLDEQSGERPAGAFPPKRGSSAFFGLGDAENRNEFVGQMKDKGGASRFFYMAKASREERNMGCEGLEEKSAEKRTPKGQGIMYEKGFNAPTKNYHPTVKPLKLMEYLCILTKTPTGGIVLDPFAGSGTTGMACKKTGRDFILIEKEKEYCKIAKARIKTTPMPLL